MTKQRVTYENIESDDEEQKPCMLVRIFVGVKYVDKEIAKSLGAKWNKIDKKWFFEFPLTEFETNEEINTNIFKPFSAVVYVPKGVSKSSIEYEIFDRQAMHTYFDILYKKASNRYKEFMKKQST